jgi:DNA polymerase-3 subunit delta
MLILSRFTSKEEIKFYYDEYDHDIATNHLKQSSLFGDNNLLIVKHNISLGVNLIKELIDITLKNKNSFFIYEFYEKQTLKTDAKKIANIFNQYKNKNVGEVRFFKPFYNNAIGILIKKASALKIDINRENIEYLYNFFDQDLALGMNELDKFSTSKEYINSKTIDRLSYNVSGINYQKLFICIFKKENVIIKIKKLIQEGQKEVLFIQRLSSFVKELFLYHSYIHINGYVDSKEILGYKPPRFIEEPKVALVNKELKNIKTIQKILNQLQKDELLLKTNPKGDKESILLSTIIKIQGFL